MARALSTDDVCTYLKSLKLGQYVELFMNNDVDGTLMWEMTSEGLEALGVADPFHRCKIKAKFNDYLQQLSSSLY